MTGQLPPAKILSRAGEPDRRGRTAAVCAVLAAIIFAVFGQTVGHQFVNFDDDLYVYENPMVARGLTSGGIKWAFTQVHSVNWHPLTWLSHMLDCQLYGLRPGGHHLTNVIIHAAAVIALFLVLRRMTAAFWPSAFVAAVFAVHPLRVESVAWVAERKDVLSGFFFLLTIAAYARFALRPSMLRYTVVVLLSALGLMCKPMLVTVPFILLLLDYWPLQRKEPLAKLVLEKLPLLALSLAACAITLLAQQEAIHSGGVFSVANRLGNAVVSCMVYLGQMIWPAGLAVLYPFPQNGPPVWKVALAALSLAAISWMAWRTRRTQPWIGVGWLWYLVMLLPVAGIIQVGRQAHADRYTYLPQVGIYLGLTWWIAGLRLNRAILATLAGGVIAALMFCSWTQTQYWKDSETLWTHTLACTSDNDVAENNLGLALYDKGRLDEAAFHYQQALKIKPDYAGARNNLGLLLWQKGRVNEAILDYQEALKIQPSFAQARNNLGLAVFQQGKVDEAMADYQAAIKELPDFPEAHNNLGNALLRKGQMDGAIFEFDAAIPLKPAYADAENNLATALRQAGRIDEAISHFQQSLAIAPGNESVHFNLARALLQKGRVAEAMAQYQTALQIQPDDIEVQNNLAWLLATGSQASFRNGAKAVELAWRANQLSGGKNPVILGTLAAAFAEAGKFEEARRTAIAAINAAQTARQPELARQFAGALKLYESNQPLRQPASR